MDRPRWWQWRKRRGYLQELHAEVFELWAKMQPPIPHGAITVEKINVNAIQAAEITGEMLCDALLPRREDPPS